MTKWLRCDGPALGIRVIIGSIARLRLSFLNVPANELDLAGDEIDLVGLQHRRPSAANGVGSFCGGA